MRRAVLFLIHHSLVPLASSFHARVPGCSATIRAVPTHVMPRTASVQLSYGSVDAAAREEKVAGAADLTDDDDFVPELIPYGELKLSSSAHVPALALKTFSIFSWNCLLPNSIDNWWCEKMYQSHVPEEARQWPHRQQLIQDRIALANADIVCIQEAAADTFESDFGFMRDMGYDVVLHKKFRFRCATFYRPTAFTLQSVAHEDRALVTSFVRPDDAAGAELRPLYLANVHLSGGAAPERRLRQVHGVTERVRKWAAAAAKPTVALKGRKGSPSRLAQEASLARAQAASPPSPPSVIIAGDFNSDGNTAVRRLLVEGLVEPVWREPQYGEATLTSKPRAHPFGPFADAGEDAYRQNVCDGDWGDWGARTNYDRYRARRPATYVVPSLASVFLERTPSATCRQQVVADHEVLARLVQHQEQPPRQTPRQLSADDRALCEAIEGADTAFVEACRLAFDAIDYDRGGSLSASELRDALERLSVRSSAGEEASAADAEAMLSAADADSDGEIDFGEFVAIVLSGGGGGGGRGSGWWTRFLRMLRGDDAEAAGANDTPAAAELVRLESEADVEALIERFTPSFRAALDRLFDRLAAAPAGVAAGAAGAAGAASAEAAQGHATEAVAEPDGAASLAISEASALSWLELVNRELGRGGTYRGVMAAFEESERVSGRRELTRRAWYGVFARELGEGKWWQVAYDLEVSGVAVSDFELDADGMYGGGATGRPRPATGEPPRVRAPRRHYEAWLDYVYYTPRGGLRLVGYQESLDEELARRIYQEGDALPNAWHPSDHLPVGCVFEWA